MKNKYIIFAMLILAAGACTEKNTPVDGPDADKARLVVRCPGEAMGKAYFEDETSGNLHWRWEYFTIAGIPVEEDPGTGDLTLLYDKAITGERETYSGNWSYDNLYFYCQTDKTPFEFFADYDKLVFLMVANASVYDYSRFNVIYNGSTNETRFYEDGQYAYGNLNRFWNLPVDGEDHYCFATAVSNRQHAVIEKRTGVSSSRGYEHCQTICGYSDVVTLDDVIDNGYGVTFKGFKPANALLGFNMKVDGEASFSVHSIDISIKSRTDHSGDGTGWYHHIAGPTYTFFTVPDFSASTPGEYDMRAVPSLLKAWECSMDALMPYFRMSVNGNLWWNHLYDNLDENASKIFIDWEYHDDSYSSDYNYGFPLSSTPTEDRIYAVILPQTEFVDSDSYLLFEAKDQNGVVISTATKPLPEGGFLPGKRYDFTLTLPALNSDTSASNAGKYEEGDWE